MEDDLSQSQKLDGRLVGLLHPPPVSFHHQPQGLPTSANQLHFPILPLKIIRFADIKVLDEGVEFRDELRETEADRQSIQDIQDMDYRSSKICLAGDGR